MEYGGYIIWGSLEGFEETIQKSVWIFFSLLSTISLYISRSIFYRMHSIISMVGIVLITDNRKKYKHPWKIINKIVNYNGIASHRKYNTLGVASHIKQRQ